VQLYLADLEASCSRAPATGLRGFWRAFIFCQAKPAAFLSSFLHVIFRSSTSAAFACWSRAASASAWAQPADARSQELTGQSPLSVEFDLLGQTVELPVLAQILRDKIAPTCAASARTALLERTRLAESNQTIRTG